MKNLNKREMKVALPKVTDKKEIEIYTVEEQKQFIRSLEGHRHKALIILVFATGLRIGYVLALKYCDVDFENSTLTVVRNFKRVHLM